ncbi:MAG TPA: M20/M25/M40 family metallo-hydrolase [Bryobacteraceae bacterium]|nr:M20/M25/M40 family metallo-hydrolase [Bryobacteraceae bacterium]HZW96291.1 M20/M25/M40 family metallo-hydrolase [Candidatus Eremiobacteraceae bacterium]
MQPTDRVERLLEELSNASGPSGFEGPVREIVARELRGQGLEVSTDGLGSVIGVLRGSSGGPRIMLAAHMDEVGAMVRFVTPEGMVKFQLLGGWLDQALVDQRWTILTRKGPLTAISGLRSVHITPADDRNRVTLRDDVFLDVGARSKDEAEALGVHAGDPIVPAVAFTEIADRRYTGKAMDDRVGCVMLLETLRRLKEQGSKTPNTIYFVGTVQEEVGLRGAHTAAQAIKPDLGISLEAGIAADHPGGRPDWAQERLGAGPVVYLADAAMLVNLRLRDSHYAGSNYDDFFRKTTQVAKVICIHNAMVVKGDIRAVRRPGTAGNQDLIPFNSNPFALNLHCVRIQKQRATLIDGNLVTF